WSSPRSAWSAPRDRIPGRGTPTWKPPLTGAVAGCRTSREDRGTNERGRSMAHPNEELARNASDALAAHDYDTFLTFQQEDVVVHTPQGETLRGKDAVRENFARLDSMTDQPSE